MSSAAEGQALRRFVVRLVDSDGGVADIELEAESPDAAARLAARQGRAVLSVLETGLRRDERRGRSRRRVGARLCSEVALLMKSGLTIEEALAALTRFKGPRSRSRLAESLLLDIRSGVAFHQALSARPDVFPEPFAQVAEAGEASGALGAALSDLADFVEARDRLDADIRGALIYPAILLVAAFIATAMILIVVVPRFEALFDDTAMSLPALTEFVFSTARFAVVAAPIVVGLAIIGALWLRVMMQSVRFRRAWDRFLLELPVFGGFLREALAARLTRLLALMLRNGLSAEPALRRAALASGNAHMRAALEAAVGRVRSGRGFGEEIANAGVLPDLVCELLMVGEEGGDLEGASARLADLYETRLRRSASVALRIAEPVIILFVGLILGLIIISILVALVSINDSAI